MLLVYPREKRKSVCDPNIHHPKKIRVAYLSIIHIATSYILTTSLDQGLGNGRNSSRGFCIFFSTYKLIITCFFSQRVGQNQHGTMESNEIKPSGGQSKCHGPSSINTNSLVLTVEFDHCSLR